MDHLAVIFAATFKPPTKVFSLHTNQCSCWTCKKHFAYVQGSGRGRETTEWWSTAL